jgi:two-component system, NtrC family, response regulator GlrR
MRGFVYGGDRGWEESPLLKERRVYRDVLHERSGRRTGGDHHVRAARHPAAPAPGCPRENASHRRNRRRTGCATARGRVDRGGRAGHVLALLRAGAADFILPPLRLGEVLPRIWCALDRHARCLPKHTGARLSGASGIIGKSPAFKGEIERLPRIAGCNASVLISGETGTGKELFARAIHDLSPRARYPFVPLNCGAIPGELAESELFGHERGAFTGAHAASRGVIREAEGGTLFLDEVTSLSLPMQVKLLRFLQEKEVRPLGNGSLHRVDVRVIAAADQDIDGDVRVGRLRRDLYYRLNTISIWLPPLRERREDIPLLARFFLSRFGGHLGATFSEDAFQKLLRYDWPGNVRELEHVVERTVVLSPDGNMCGRDIALPGVSEETPPKDRTAKLRIISQFERTYVEELLALYRGNISRAAREAGKNRRAFWELIRKHGISVERYRRDASAQCPRPAWGRTILRAR